MSQPEKSLTEKSKSENFPVGSHLLPARFRPHVMAYYAFARTADDIADDPDLAPKEKIKRLNTLEAVLNGTPSPNADTAMAEDFRLSCAETGVDPACASDLLKAFRMDSEGHVYESFQDLMGYCRYSAAPVGRFLLTLHKEEAFTALPGDSLCAALQILNHLQDCKEDFLTLKRVYLPADWMREEKLSTDILAGSETPLALRRVFDKTLDAVDGLLHQAAPLPSLIRSRGLRMEVAIILQLATRLTAHLRAEDPLASKVGLKKKDWLSATCRGMINGFFFPKRMRL